MSSRIYVYFPPRVDKPPLTRRDRLNPHPCLQRHPFPAPRYAKRPGVALYSIDPLSPLLTTSSSYCTLKITEHNLFWQSPAAHLDESPRPQKIYIHANGCVNALGYLSGTVVVESQPMVWSLALCSYDVKQDPVAYGAEFGVVVVFMAKGPRTVSYSRVSITSALTIGVLKERATFGWSKSSFRYIA